MSSYFTPRIRTYTASAFFDSISPRAQQKWTTATSYNEGEIVVNSNNRYIAKTSGTSGAIPPSHVSGTVSDGGVFWIWVETVVLNDVFNKSVYLSIGKRTDWKNEPAVDDIRALESQEQTIINDAITFKKLTTDNFRLGVSRVNWTANQIYSQYDSSKDPVAVSGSLSYDHPFFVFTDDNNLYKCINNNNGSPSTVKPTSVSVSQFYLSDGYVWKFMGKMDLNSTSFLTQSFVPVKYKTVDDGSEQWQVQTASKKGSLSTFNVIKKIGTFPSDVSISLTGSATTPASAYVTKNVDQTINQVLVQANSIGEGYDHSQQVYAVVRKQTATGSGAEVTSVTVNSGSVQSVSFTSGSGYTGTALCLLIDEKNVPTDEAIVEVDVVSGAVSNVRVLSGGAGYSDTVKGFIVPGDSGAVARAVFAPKDGHGFNVLTELVARTAICVVSLNDTSGYMLFGEDNSYRQIALLTDLVDFGTTDLSSNQLYIGPAHTQYGNPTFNRIDRTRGKVLYVHNRSKIVRETDKEETIKLTLMF